MKPVHQTSFDELGNCYAACIASILELPIESVPNFCEDKKGWTFATQAWLRERGLGIVNFRVLPESIAEGFEFGVISQHAYYIVSGKSPRGYTHAVVGLGGEIVHDPHPDGGGIVPFEDGRLEYEWIVLIDPVKVSNTLVER